jgi:hypothetical protein
MKKFIVSLTLALVFVLTSVSVNAGMFQDVSFTGWIPSYWAQFQYSLYQSQLQNMLIRYYSSAYGANNRIFMPSSSPADTAYFIYNNPCGTDWNLSVVYSLLGACH